MNKNEKKASVATRKKEVAHINRQLPTEVKDSKIELFTRKSDELAEVEAKKRKQRQKQKNSFITNGGIEVNVADFVSELYADKKTHYYKSFYNLIADLLGESHEIMKPFRKKRIVAVLKRMFIWGRFPNAVQAKIYSKNKYTGFCTRDYWNYQLLTKTADGMCFDYIREFEETAVEVLSKNGRLKEFIVEHSIKCGLPIQLDAFDGLLSE